MEILGVTEKLAARATYNVFLLAEAVPGSVLRPDDQSSNCE